MNAVQWAVSTYSPLIASHTNLHKGIRMDDESTNSLMLLSNRYHLSTAVLSSSNQELVKHVHECELPERFQQQLARSQVHF